MSLRCRPGDLAFVVRSRSNRNIGAVVRCLRLSALSEMLYPEGSVQVGSIWEIDGELFAWDGSPSRFAPDCYLRPIRDEPGQDEMLAIAGKPEPVPASAPPPRSNLAQQASDERRQLSASPQLISHMRHS